MTLKKARINWIASPIEPLETRRLFSTLEVSPNPIGAVLGSNGICTVWATNQDNDIRIVSARDPATGAITYDVLGVTITGTRNLRGVRGFRVFLGGGNDSLTFDLGNQARHAALRNTIYGTDGADVIIGSPGQDRIYGGSGPDTIAGLGGRDRIYGDQDDDVITAGAGSDNVSGGDGNDDIAGLNGNDRIYGDAGLDSISGGSHNDILDGGEDVDVLVGGKGNDALTGSTGDDSLYGNDGADRLSGNGGDDCCFGGAGSDMLRGGDGADELMGGAGIDLIDSQKEDKTDRDDDERIADGAQVSAFFDNALVGTDWSKHLGGANAVVGKYTYFGDVNLDGQVTGDDYIVIDPNVVSPPAVTSEWLSGDMNLDGVVTGEDYTVIDSNTGLG